MDSTNRNIIAIFLLLIVEMIEVNGHGRLMDPPGRNSMWRVGFSTVKNYNDDQLYCGGLSVKWAQKEGKCGICGDAYNVARPRPHEAGGKYATGTIGKSYVEGQIIEVTVELTTNHQGHFVFRLCPNNDPSREVTQECLDRYPLYLAGTTNEKFEIPPRSPKKVIFRYEVQLPRGVTCSQCVVQWDYYAANNWGICPDGVGREGCGPGELYRNCADVSITPWGARGRRDLENFRDNPQYKSQQVCVPTDSFKVHLGSADWCQTNCFNNPPNCPKEFCFCPKSCVGIGEMAGQEGADAWCNAQCLVYPSKCPDDKCCCR